MVFKGFTDENGNVIPVQGAGIVYNEEKNSLALGKDTVATGQDQFVFGRQNIPDTTKAEIVGGGSQLFTFKRKGTSGYPDTIIFENVKLIRIGTSSDLVEFLLQHNALSNYLLYDGSLKMAADTEIMFYPELTNHYSFYLIAGEGDGSESPIIAVVDNPEVGDYVYSVSGITSKSYSQGETPNDEIKSILFQNINLFISYIGSEKSGNIRTLDWEGTQWNAGDITCDDGNGITISMRDLLRRIAALETAANS